VKKRTLPQRKIQSEQDSILRLATLLGRIVVGDVRELPTQRGGDKPLETGAKNAKKEGR